MLGERRLSSSLFECQCPFESSHHHSSTYSQPSQHTFNIHSVPSNPSAEHSPIQTRTLHGEASKHQLGRHCECLTVLAARRPPWVGSLGETLPSRPAEDPLGLTIRVGVTSAPACFFFLVLCELPSTVVASFRDARDRALSCSLTSRADRG
jgi:hypothetical protein